MKLHLKLSALASVLSLAAQPALVQHHLRISRTLKGLLCLQVALDANLDYCVKAGDVKIQHVVCMSICMEQTCLADLLESPVNNMWRFDYTKPQPTCLLPGKPFTAAVQSRLVHCAGHVVTLNITCWCCSQKTARMGTLKLYEQLLLKS